MVGSYFYLVLSCLGIGTIVGGIAGVFIFIRITGGSGEPSIPISAPTLSVQSIVTSTDSDVAINVVEATDTTELNSTPQFQPVTSPTSEISQPVRIVPTATFIEPIDIEPTATPLQPTPAILPPRLFRIVSEESEARFSVYENFPAWYRCRANQSSCR